MGPQLGCSARPAKSHSFNLDQQFRPTNIRCGVDRRHAPKTLVTDLFAALEIFCPLQVNTNLRQIFQSSAGFFDPVEPEILGGNQFLNVLDRLLRLLLNVPGMSAERVNDAGGARQPGSDMVS